MRRKLLLLGVLLLLVCLALAAFHLWWEVSGHSDDARFSGLENMTEQQVIARCGNSDFDSRSYKNSESQPHEGANYRDFKLGFTTWRGARYMVEFSDGRVARCYLNGSK
jgi:hypothetical protein